MSKSKKITKKITKRMRCFWEDNIKPRQLQKYWVEVIYCQDIKGYFWAIKGINGKFISYSKAFSSKNQCLRTAKAFIEWAGLEMR